MSNSPCLFFFPPVLHWTNNSLVVSLGHTHTHAHTPKKVKCVIFARAGYFKTQRTSMHPVNFLRFYLFSLLEVIIATSWYAPIFQDVDFWERICEESQIPQGLKHKDKSIIILKNVFLPLKHWPPNISDVRVIRVLFFNVILWLHTYLLSLLLSFCSF